MDSSRGRTLALAVFDEEEEQAPKKRRFWVHDIKKKEGVRRIKLQ